MRRKELSEIIERNQLAFERNGAAFERNTIAFERVMAALDRLEERFEEDRVFIRDMNRRNERVIQDLLKGNAELVKGNADFSAEQKRRTEEIVAEMREARQESRAHREAILAMLDRLPPAQAA